MRYNLFVDTAARFVPSVYGAIADGLSLAEAVTKARRAIQHDQQSGVGEDDWIVPVVYEATPVTLAPASRTKTEREAVSRTQEFVGRDSTILAIDRLLDAYPVVLLHGMLGIGKTATVKAFSDWYQRTGGASSAEFHRFGPDSCEALEQRAASMPAIAELWIIDGVESAIGADQQTRLVAAIRKLVQRGSRVILTSRVRAEWLGDLAAPVRLGEMSMSGRTRLLASLLSRSGIDFRPDEWRSALIFTGGNPLALQTIAEVGLRLGLKDPRILEDTLFKLARGERPDAETLPPDLLRLTPGSFLGQRDWKCLSVLRHHIGFADARHISQVFQPNGLDDAAVLGPTTEDEWYSVFLRAAAAGLMVKAHDTYFQIHPLLSLAVMDALDASGEPPVPLDLVERAYVQLMNVMGRSAQGEFESGAQRERSLKWMSSEESNLLHGWQLALQNEWWDSVAGPLTGLHYLYQQLGRTREWAGLIDRTWLAVSDSNGQPLPGREEAWFVVAAFTCMMAQEHGELALAQRLAKDLLQQSEKDEGLNRHLGASLRLADIKRLDNNPESVALYMKALEGYQALEDRPAQAVIQYNIALCYQEIPAIRDFAKAREHYALSLGLHQVQDGMALAKIFSQLASVAMQEAMEFEKTGGDPQEIERRFDYAFRASLPLVEAPLATVDRAIIYSRLAMLLRRQGKIDEAFEYDNKALECSAAAGDSPGEASARYNLALDLRAMGRLDDALLYALAARNAFQALGEVAAGQHEVALQLCRGLEGDH